MRFDELQPGDLMVWGEGGRLGIEAYLYLHFEMAAHRIWLHGWSLKKGYMELIMTGEIDSEVLCAVYRDGVKITK